MQKYSLLLIDADATLYDFDRSEKEAIYQALKEKGIVCDDEMYASYRTINFALWESLYEGKISKKDILKDRFRLFFEKYCIKEDPVAFNERYLDHLAMGDYVIDGAYEACKELSKICTIAIATNGVSRVQHSRVNLSKLKPFISYVIVSDETGFQKPQAEYFDYALKTIGFPKEKKGEVLMIGDSLTSDIQGGINFGIDTCWYNPHHLKNTKKIFPTYEIEHLDKLKEIVVG